MHRDVCRFNRRRFFSTDNRCAWNSAYPVWTRERPTLHLTARRYPACRLVLPPAAAIDLINKMQQIAAALTQAGLLKAVRPGGRQEQKRFLEVRIASAVQSIHQYGTGEFRSEGPLIALDVVARSGAARNKADPAAIPGSPGGAHGAGPNSFQYEMCNPLEYLPIMQGLGSRESCEGNRRAVSDSGRATYGCGKVR